MTSEGFHIYGLDPYQYYSAGYACYLSNTDIQQDSWDIWDNHMPITQVKNGNTIGYKYFGFGGLAEARNGLKAFEGTKQGNKTEFNLFLTPTTTKSFKVNVWLDVWLVVVGLPEGGVPELHLASFTTTKLHHSVSCVHHPALLLYKPCTTIVSAIVQHKAKAGCHLRGWQAAFCIFEWPPLHLKLVMNSAPEITSWRGYGSEFLVCVRDVPGSAHRDAGRGSGLAPCRGRGDLCARKRQPRSRHAPARTRSHTNLLGRAGNVAHTPQKF